MRRNVLLFFRALWALLTSTPLPVRGGRAYLHPDGTVLPVIAGGSPDDPDDKDKDADKDKDPDDGDKDKDADKDKDPDDGDKDKDADKDDLGEGGKRALAAERDRAKEAERRAKAAEKKLQEKEDAELDDKEKAEKRAERAEEANEAATAKLRKANLLTALAGEDYKLTGAKGKAAARLLDGGVEFDEDTDEPTNLEDAIKAAKAEYGEDAFKAATAEGGEDKNGGAAQGARQGGGSDKPEGLAGALAAHVNPNDK